MSKLCFLQSQGVSVGAFSEYDYGVFIVVSMHTLRTSAHHTSPRPHCTLDIFAWVLGPPGRWTVHGGKTPGAANIYCLDIGNSSGASTAKTCSKWYPCVSVSERGDQGPAQHQVRSWGQPVLVTTDWAGLGWAGLAAGHSSAQSRARPPCDHT